MVRVAIPYGKPLLTIVSAIKSGNRQDAKECLDIAARGLVKTHYQLRGMNEVTDVSRERYL